MIAFTLIKFIKFEFCHSNPNFDASKYLSCPRGSVQVEVPDFDAFCGHADHQEQVDGRDDAEDDVPEPEKGEDLL